jgi:predicted transcriptional regulator
MTDTHLSLQQLRERLDRAHDEAREVIAESRQLRIKLRELVDRLRREWDKEIGRL